MEEETTRVEIADHTGHTVAQMSRGQVMDLINGSEGWVYAGGRRVEPDYLAISDWSTVGTISVMPRIMYG